MNTRAQGDRRPASPAIDTAAKYAAGAPAPSVVSSGRTISAGSGFTHPTADARRATIHDQRTRPSLHETRPGTY